MQRAATAVSRATQSLMRAPRQMVRRGHDEAHHDHHDHRTFEAPFKPFGAPLAVASFVVFGGLGVTYTAIAWQQSKWVKA